MTSFLTACPTNAQDPPTDTPYATCRKAARLGACWVLLLHMAHGAFQWPLVSHTLGQCGACLLTAISSPCLSVCYADLSVELLVLILSWLPLSKGKLTMMTLGKAWHAAMANPMVHLRLPSGGLSLGRVHQGWRLPYLLPFLNWTSPVALGQLLRQ